MAPHAEAEVEQLRQELESVRQQLQASRQSAAQEQADQTRLQHLHQTHAQELNSAHAEFERLWLSHVQELSLVKSELAEMRSQHNAQGAKLLELQQQHAEVPAQAQQASELATRLAEVQTEAAGLQATQKELTQQLATAQTRCEEIQQQLAAAQSKAERSAAAEQQASAELQRLQTEQAHAQHAKHELVSTPYLLHLADVLTNSLRFGQSHTAGCFQSPVFLKWLDAAFASFVIQVLSRLEGTFTVLQISLHTTFLPHAFTGCILCPQITRWGCSMACRPLFS